MGLPPLVAIIFYSFVMPLEEENRIRQRGVEEWTEKRTKLWNVGCVCTTWRMINVLWPVSVCCFGVVALLSCLWLCWGLILHKTHTTHTHSYHTQPTTPALNSNITHTHCWLLAANWNSRNISPDFCCQLTMTTCYTPSGQLASQLKLSIAIQQEIRII